MKERKTIGSFGYGPSSTLTYWRYRCKNPLHRRRYKTESLVRETPFGRKVLLSVLWDTLLDSWGQVPIEVSWSIHLLARTFSHKVGVSSEVYWRRGQLYADTTVVSKTKSFLRGLFRRGFGIGCLRYTLFLWQIRWFETSIRQCFYLLCNSFFSW